MYVVLMGLFLHSFAHQSFYTEQINHGAFRIKYLTHVFSLKRHTYLYPFKGG